MGAYRPKVDLAGLAFQLSQMAETVRQQCETRSGDGAGAGETLRGVIDDGVCSELVTIAVAWMRASAEREAAFGPGLFSDPAWNMLLDLYIQRARGRSVSVTSLSIASGTPATTALRWIALLEDKELVTREPDRFDRRRYFVHLTDRAVGRIEAALRGARESDEKLGLGRLQRLN